MGCKKNYDIKKRQTTNTV